MRLPHFIIAGAPRSQTSRLWHMLMRHPDVAMAALRPEPKFFLVDESYQQGLEYYSKQWFSALPKATVLGEKSTNYLESAKAAERIAVSLPDVKLIFILRDPVTRAFSNYRWSRQNGMEQASFSQALAQEEARESELDPKLRFARPHAYYSRGLYAELLTPYFERFKREQIRILFYEQMLTDPTSMLCTVHRFLELPERPGDAMDLGVVNPSQDTGPDSLQLDLASEQQLRQRYRTPNHALRQLLQLDTLPWPQ
uniref:Putative sulfotransferase protein n=1 Tax=Magnetococcus massalia (strain MO-1) TaxID=451514 RepID=A0A1S7LEG6_MAGMO|nr:Putative sulfotransferase protein [Candidatus Magnetococcus massalia]